MRDPYRNTAHPEWDRPAREVAPGVEVNPRKLGGKPCLAGTRMTTAQIDRMMRDYGREFIRGGWPYLTDAQISTACNFEARQQ